MGIHTYRCTEEPTQSGVYRVMVSLHGVTHPRAHEPTLYAYYDGVDTWGGWEFSINAAMHAKPSPRFKPVGWNGPV